MAKNGRSEMEGAWTLMIRGGQNSPERPTWELPVCEDRNYASPVSFVLFCFFGHLQSNLILIASVGEPPDTALFFFLSLGLCSFLSEASSQSLLRFAKLLFMKQLVVNCKIRLPTWLPILPALALLHLYFIFLLLTIYLLSSCLLYCVHSSTCAQ